METNFEQQIDNFLLNFKKKTLEADFFSTGLTTRNRSNSMEMGECHIESNVKFNT